MGTRRRAMWRSCVAWILVVSTGLSGCALRRHTPASPDREKAAGMQMRIDSHRRGTPIRLRLDTGERVKGVLVLVDAETVSIESKRGEPPRVIPRTSIVDVAAEAEDIGRWAWAGLLILPVTLLLLRKVCQQPSQTC